MPAYPGESLWATAIDQARLAADLAPGDPEALRLLAELYTTTRWYGRAWPAWQDYRNAAGALDDQALQDGADTGTTFAFLRYQAGELEQALEIYRQVIRYHPSDPRGYVWAGRILLELGDPETAIPYWEQAVELDPADEGAAYFLTLARDQARFGVVAAADLYEGIRLYEAGELDGALPLFQDAAQENPEFREAFVWAGRTGLELGRPELARDYWQRALTLDPENEAAAYFLELAEDQIRWGVEAVTAFREGVAFYEQGELAFAQGAFRTASSANPDYAAAWAWLGRTLFEQSSYAPAETAYRRASELEPDNEVYLYFTEESGRRLAEGR